MNNLLMQENILTELLWEAEDLSRLDPPVQSAFRTMVKANRKLVYRDYEGKLATGYCNKLSASYEPFAIYIKNLFGDGIYFSHQAAAMTYLLVISAGRIVSGTDCFIARTLFDELMLHPAEYEHLEVKPLTSVHLEAVIKECRNHQALLKHRRRFFMMTAFFAMVVLFMVLGIMLPFFT